MLTNNINNINCKYKCIQLKDITQAALVGHYDCAKELQSQGYILDITHSTIELKLNYIETFEYFLENNSPVNWHEFLSMIDYCPIILDLDKKIWRKYLFNRKLKRYKNLNKYVKEKKQKELDAIKSVLDMCLSDILIPRDVVKYVVFKYIQV